MITDIQGSPGRIQVIPTGPNRVRIDSSGSGGSGAQGPQGSPGAQGSTGPQGASGVSGCILCLCAALTPTSTGADNAEVTVPYDPTDGTSSITWNVRRLGLRVQTAGGAPSVTVEKSTASGSFSATSVGTVTLSTGAYEGSVTSGLGTVSSGDKIRFNVVTLATAQNWTIEVELGV